jgi:hypothetical protein
MLGYYWAPALTAQPIYADGSFNTGDPPVAPEALPAAAGKFLKHKLWEATPWLCQPGQQQAPRRGAP